MRMFSMRRFSFSSTMESLESEDDTLAGEGTDGGERTASNSDALRSTERRAKSV